MVMRIILVICTTVGICMITYGLIVLYQFLVKYYNSHKVDNSIVTNLVESIIKKEKRFDVITEQYFIEQLQSLYPNMSAIRNVVDNLDEEDKVKFYEIRRERGYATSYVELIINFASLCYLRYVELGGK